MGLRMTGGDRIDSGSRQGPDWPGQRVTSGRTCWSVRVVGSRITKAWLQLRVPPLSCYMTLDKTFLPPRTLFLHQQTVCGLIERRSLLGWLERYVGKQPISVQSPPPSHIVSPSPDFEDMGSNCKICTKIEKQLSNLERATKTEQNETKHY